MALNEDCTQGTGLACTYSILIIICAVSVFILNCLALIRIAWQTKRITYELVAIFFACLNSLLILIHKGSAANIMLIFVNNVFHLIIYLIINYSFVKGYYVLKYQLNPTNNFRKLNFVFLGISLLVFIFFILGLCQVPDFSCPNRFQFHWVVLTIFSILLAASSFFFGVAILLISRKTEADEKQNELLESVIESTEQGFYKQQRHAIITLIISFFFSTVIGVILDGIAKYRLENESGIICHNDGYMISEDDNSETILFLRLFFELFPIFMLPIALFFLKFMSEREWRKSDENDINFEALEHDDPCRDTYLFSKSSFLNKTKSVIIANTKQPK